MSLSCCARCDRPVRAKAAPPVRTHEQVPATSRSVNGAKTPRHAVRPGKLELNPTMLHKIYIGVPRMLGTCNIHFAIPTATDVGCPILVPLVPH